MIIGLAECQLETENVLRARGSVGDVTAPQGSLESRDGFAYLTLRGCEESSILLGIRSRTGNSLELLFWERRREGTYRRSSGGGKKAEAYTRCMVAKVDTHTNVGFIGKTHNVMAIHLHNHLANNKWPKKLQAFWTWLMEKLVRFDVNILMGDFNMSLFSVIPELRSRGAEVELGAWFPWKSLLGTAMSDSCGMCFSTCQASTRCTRALGTSTTMAGMGF